MGLARSTYFYQKAASQTVDKYAEIKVQIQAIYADHKGRYGYRRVALALRRAGQLINHKTVQRLMIQLGLRSLVRVKKYVSFKGVVGRIARNLLKRKFTSKRPLKKLVTDITEFRVGEEKLYLSPVMDLYNGEIVAFKMARRPVYAMVNSMLAQLLAKLKPGRKVLLHSDQGWHYQMPSYRHTLRTNGIRQSMSRKGNCHDNAAMESFFGLLKSEYFHLTKVASIDELEAGLKQYIHYYNNDRIKQSLNGLSPVQYRTQAMAK